MVTPLAVALYGLGTVCCAVLAMRVLQGPLSWGVRFVTDNLAILFLFMLSYVMHSVLDSGSATDYAYLAVRVHTLSNDAAPGAKLWMAGHTAVVFFHNLLLLGRADPITVLETYMAGERQYLTTEQQQIVLSAIKTRKRDLEDRRVKEKEQEALERAKAKLQGQEWLLEEARPEDKLHLIHAVNELQRSEAVPVLGEDVLGSIDALPPDTSTDFVMPTDAEIAAVTPTGLDEKVLKEVQQSIERMTK